MRPLLLDIALNLRRLRPGSWRESVEGAATDVGEEHAADAAEDADGRQHGFDQREAELGVEERRFVAEELQYS